MTTKHSLRRAKGRMGLSKTMARNAIDRAELFGLTSDYFTGDERAYLVSKERNGTFPVVYEGFCYIFSTNMVCVTVITLPDWFDEKQRYDHKKKIRNYRVYRQHYPENEQDDEWLEVLQAV